MNDARREARAACAPQSLLYFTPTPTRPMQPILRRATRALATLSLVLLPLSTARLEAQKSAPAPASPDAEREGVRRAVLDYVEGF